MRFFKKTDINFIGFRKTAFYISAILIVVSVISIGIRRGSNLGIDFVGGTLIQLKVDPMPSMEDIRMALSAAGLMNPQIQNFPQSGEIIIRIKSEKPVLSGEGAFFSGEEGSPPPEASTGETMTLSSGISAGDTAPDTAPEVAGAVRTRETEGRILEIFRDKFPSSGVEVKRVEMVGPAVGKELGRKALWAFFWGMIAIMVYVGWRFEFKYSAPAVIALVHDVLIVVGLLSLFNMEISVTVIAALLTLAGYSINDTIVIYDRIREKRRLFARDELKKVMNLAINDTLSRTVVTASTTAVVLLVLFLVGGKVIHDFSFALLVGIGIGTYSSIFVASPLVYEWERRHRKLR